MKTPRVETHEHGGGLITDLLRVQLDENVLVLQEDERLDQEEVHQVTVFASPGCTVELIGQGPSTVVLRVRRS